MTRRGWIDFKEVKEAATFEPILRHYGLELRAQGAELVGLCPFHEERKPSFRVHPTKRVFHCFGCNARGGILDFVMQKEGVPIREAARLVAEWCGITARSAGQPSSPSPPARRPKPETPAGRQEAARAEIRPLSFTLRLSDESDYLRRRIPSPEARAAFGVGFCGRGMMKGRIAFPIHDAEGRLVGYAGRWAADEPPEGVERWLVPPGFPKAGVLFGLLQVRDADHVVVVENPFSVVRLAELGVRAVALLGSSLSPEQVELLARTSVRRVTLMLDGDEAGRKAASEMAPVLARRFWVRVAELPPGTQPDTVPEETLRALLAE